MSVTVFDDTACALGEGPLWHPERQQLFWFDILGKRLYTRRDGARKEWQFDEHVSAAGWVDKARLMIASETALFLFDLDSEIRTHMADLEAENTVTRSNDGRADPQGGFWIGTMGKQAEARAGAIYRWYRGELRQLFDGITVTNAICFAPDGKTAYFCDTFSRVIQRQALDAQGWPKGVPEPFIDLKKAGFNPDGAVVDREGCLWNAQWGASRVARYGPDGAFMEAIAMPATQISCPAFGGPDMKTLHLTSAAIGASENDKDAGQTFVVATSVQGQPEHRVKV